VKLGYTSGNDWNVLHLTRQRGELEKGRTMMEFVGHLGPHHLGLEV
jgi:hypothetical protein